MTISGLCESTVIADKRATVLITMVTKTYFSLISCSTIHELSVLHAWECDAMTRNVVKRLANREHVGCLFDMIGRSDMLSSDGTGKITRLEHTGLPGTKRKRPRSVRAVVPNVS